MIRFIEWLAGKLLVQATRMRLRRAGPDDAHEIRHLYAAVVHGNSDGCEPGACQLDLQALHDYFNYIDPPLPAERKVPR